MASIDGIVEEALSGSFPRSLISREGPGCTSTVVAVVASREGTIRRRKTYSRSTAGEDRTIVTTKRGWRTKGEQV